VRSRRLRTPEASKMLPLHLTNRKRQMSNVTSILNAQSTFLILQLIPRKFRRKILKKAKTAAQKNILDYRQRENCELSQTLG
jgi:hypothetical protein